jgi:hypothetical protein
MTIWLSFLYGAALPPRLTLVSDIFSCLDSGRYALLYLSGNGVMCLRLPLLLSDVYVH